MSQKDKWKDIEVRHEIYEDGTWKPFGIRS